MQRLHADGIHVVYMPLTRESGLYVHKARLIMIDSKASPTWQLWTLAHEAIHAKRGDDGPQNPRIEQLVDRQAARLLISPHEYRLAEHCYGANYTAIADEMGVPVECVEAFRQWLASTPRQAVTY